ncbi:MAG: hypothetical protein CM1200mP3_05980 [Chloroflexota bacterium]|nr:MAG: hypothetical protein CM1200mP3_05980 [Chloroflexota bacterium]
MVEEVFGSRAQTGRSTSLFPHIWATLAILGLVLLGLALVWFSSLPDFAVQRDQVKGGEKNGEVDCSRMERNFSAMELAISPNGCCWRLLFYDACVCTLFHQC